jgi:hypothetical protein
LSWLGNLGVAPPFMEAHPLELRPTFSMEKMGATIAYALQVDVDTDNGEGAPAWADFTSHSRRKSLVPSFLLCCLLLSYPYDVDGGSALMLVSLMVCNKPEI